MKNFVSREPSSPITQRAEYQAGQQVAEMETDVTVTDESAEIEATVEGMIEAVVKRNEYAAVDHL